MELAKKTYSPQAQVFIDMAERIERNPEEFGGAFVVVLPGDFKPVSSMIVGPDPDPAILLHNAMNQMQLLIDDMKQAERSSRGYGR